jgi:hypothetical protein
LSIIEEYNQARTTITKCIEELETTLKTVFGSNYVYFSFAGSGNLNIYVNSRAKAMETYPRLGDHGIKKGDTQLIGMEPDIYE